jgi:hypothetical protein
MRWMYLKIPKKWPVVWSSKRPLASTNWGIPLKRHAGFLPESDSRLAGVTTRAVLRLEGAESV